MGSQFPVCPEGTFNLIGASPCSLTWLRFIVPLSLAGLTIIFHVLRRTLPRRILHLFSLLFSDPSSLHAVSELPPSLIPVEPTNAPINSDIAKAVFAKSRRSVKYRHAILVSLGLVQACLALYRMGSAIIDGPTWEKWMEAGIAVSWIYTSGYIFLIPSTRPYYSCLFIYVIHCGLSITSLAIGGYVKNARGVQPLWFTKSWIAQNALDLAVDLILIATMLRMRVANDMDVQKIADIQIDDNPTLSEWLTFSWVTPVVQRGYDHELADDEVPLLSTTMRTAPLFAIFNDLPQKHLLSRILRANGLDLFLDCSLTIASVACDYASPYFIKKILESVGRRGEDPTAIPNAYIYASLSLLAGVLKSLLDVIHLWHGRRLSVRVKNELIAAIYNKALRRKDASGVTAPADAEKKDGAAKDGKDGNADAKKGGTAEVGKIVSLMAGDTNRLAMTMSALYFLSSALANIPIAAVALFNLLGFSGFLGLAAMLATGPITKKLGARSFAISKDLLKARDRRITATSETLIALKAVKFFGWVPKFEERILVARKEEMRHWIRSTINGIYGSFVFALGPVLVTLVAFTSYIYIEHRELDVATAFTALTIFNMIRQPLNMIPFFIVQLSQAHASLTRIEDFLAEPEVEDWVSSLKPPPEPHSEISMKNATFSWNKDADQTPSDSRFQLEDININFPLGKLSLILGPTGAGKSAMLAALLGEMDCVQGCVKLPKFRDQIEDGLRNSISYCSQSPWLQHRTIKDNIVFDEPFDRRRYEEVVEACALNPDLDALEAGEMTEVGERGISLSGGQKARIGEQSAAGIAAPAVLTTPGISFLALARACYSYTRHVLLDDVFAAVDAQTARHLFEKCLRGPIMKGRTVIIVSHHAELLMPAAALVIKVLDGRIEAAGSPQELRDQGLLEGMVALEEANANEEAPAAAFDPSKGSELADKPAKQVKRLVKDEERSKGSVEFRMYLTYIKACSYTLCIIILLLLGVNQCLALGERWWLKIWGEAYRSPEPQHFLSFSAIDPHAVEGAQHAFVVRSHSPDYQTIASNNTWPDAAKNPGFYLGGYTAITVATLLLSIINYGVSYAATYRSANKIHNGMLAQVLRATTRWIDSTPVGRMTNRFSRDIETIDSSLTSSIRNVIFQIANLVGSVVLVGSILPLFLFPAAVASLLYIRFGSQYMVTSRAMRRIEAVKRSPIFSGFEEVLHGIAVIRAYGVERTFQQKLFQQVDCAQAAFYHLWMGNRWLMLRYDWLGVSCTFFTAVFCLISKVSPGTSGVAITSANSLSQAFYWLFRHWTQLEQDFNSVERATEYLDNIPQEPPGIIEGKRPPASWPTTSREDFLRVEDLSIRYAADLPPVLKHLNFTVRPGEKIGIIGRTGSGKSTLSMALLRFVEPEGKIILDGIDITSIGTDDLRSRITYIPQDPLVWAATVRENLDPFSEHSDEELLEALEKVQLGSKNTSVQPSRATSNTQLNEMSSSESTLVPSQQVKIKLDTVLTAGGGNVSAGQRQLLAMARAILRRSNLVIADEATSSMDHATDQAIQATIRSSFTEAVVLVVAHRLETTIDFDRVLVLDKGELRELDTPINLLRRDQSIFKHLCEQSGRYQELYRLAEEAENARAQT